MAHSCDRAVFEGGELAVILGDGVVARLNALALRVLCGVGTVICDTKSSPWRFFLPFGSFYTLIPSEQPRILFDELSDISCLAGSSLLFLLSKNERYKSLVKQIEEDIESRFIISDFRGILKDRIF